METRQAYDHWATQYDTNENRTRDLEAMALRNELEQLTFESCLEIGCGTGKNTEWLAVKARQVTAVDFSEEMLRRAKEKIANQNVRFIQADITKPWEFGAAGYDLISFSLVLEHIESLDPIFHEVSRALKPGGSVYVGELHPYKQYAGSKARFETSEGVQVVDCFTHHLSDFTQAAKRQGLVPAAVNEYFDEGADFPRILTLVFTK